MRIHQLPVQVGHTATVGVFGGGRPAVLTVDDGDEVVTATLGLWAGRVRPEHTLADILGLRSEYSGVGPHTLTGPIAVEQARAGDVLRVQILRVRPGAHGFNLATPAQVSRGVLADRFPDGFVRHFTIDADRQVARSGDLTVPLRPFPGFVAVAPADADPHGSVEPGLYGGNLDISEAVAGATIWLPVLRDGALLYVGDGHAAQGNGELDGTAIECDLELLHLRLAVSRQVRLSQPRITTAEGLISVGLGPSTEVAVKQATADMVDWLGTLGLGDEDAYALCSVAGRMSVSQVVNRVVGVHLHLSRTVLPEQAAGQWQ